MNIGDVYIQVLAELGKFKADLQREAAAAGTSAGMATGDRLSTGVSQGVARAATVIGAGIGGAFVGAISGAVAFEDQLTTINTVARLPHDALQQMGDDIQRLARETGKPTAELTAGMYDLVSAGVPADQAINVLRDSAKLATGALGTTGEAVDLVTSAMNAYGLKATDSTRITDIFAKAVADGKVTAAELGASIANIAPIAAAAGVSLEEVSAGYALMTAKGTPAAQVATQMRASISALLTPNVLLNKIQKETGQNFAEMAKERGLAVALEELRKATGGNAEQFAKALGSVEAYQFALASTGENAEVFAGQITETGNASGLAAEQYDIASSSSAAQSRRLAQEIRTLAQDIGGPFVGNIGIAVGALGELGGQYGFLLQQLLGTAIGAVAGRAVPVFASAGARMGSALVAGLTEIVEALPLSPVLRDAILRSGASVGALTSAAIAAGIVAAPVVILEAVKGTVTGAIQGAFGQETLNATDLLARRAGEVIPVGIAHEVEKGGPRIEASVRDVLDQGIAAVEDRAEPFRAASDTLAVGLPAAVKTAIGSAKAALLKAPEDLAAEILERRTAWTDAVGLLARDLHNPITAAVERARLEVALFGDAVIDGIDVATPEAAKSALRLYDAWMKEFENPATKPSRKAWLESHLVALNLKIGLASQDDAIRTESEQQVALMTDAWAGLVEDAPGYANRTVLAYAGGMVAAKDAVYSAAGEVVAEARRVWQAKSPPGPDSPLHDVVEWGYNTVAALADGMRSGSKTVREAAEEAVAGVVDIVQKAIEGAADFRKAMRDIEKSMAAARAGAKGIGRSLLGDVGDAIEERRSVVEDAIAGMADAMEGPDLTRRREMSELQGFLSGEALAEGLASADPLIRARAEQAQKTVEDRLRFLSEHTDELGFTAGEQYAKGLAEAQEIAQQQVDDYVDAVNAHFDPLIASAEAVGGRAGMALANQLRAQKAEALLATDEMFASVIESFDRGAGTMVDAFAPLVPGLRRHTREAKNAALEEWRDLRDRSDEWGERWMAALAAGVRRGGTNLMAAFEEVLRRIRAMVASASPPKVGPLHDIDRQGSNLMRVLGDGVRAGGGFLRSAVADNLAGAAGVLSGATMPHLSMTAGMTALSPALAIAGAGSSAGHLTANGGPDGDTHFHFTWQSLTPPTPHEMDELGRRIEEAVTKAQRRRGVLPRATLRASSG